MVENLAFSVAGFGIGVTGSLIKTYGVKKSLKMFSLLIANLLRLPA